MNPELEELYQEVILDHSRRPRNFGGGDGLGGVSCLRPFSRLWDAAAATMQPLPRTAGRAMVERRAMLERRATLVRV